MLTYVSLAVGSGGATDPATAFAKTWAKFSTGTSPANVVTWDGRTMSYYTAGFNACAISAKEIVQSFPGPSATSGQCGALAYLLESVLAMNGIHSEWTQVQPLDGVSRMVVKNWGYSPSSASYPSQEPWQYKLVLNPGDYMVPPSLIGYGDLTNNVGLAGQGESTPLEKVFDFQFIVKIAIASGDKYYDPSYGATYPSEAGFESQAVAGYAKQIGDLAGSGNYHFRPAIVAPLTVNILFTPDPGRSM